jgi:DNA repair protein RadC
MRTKPITYRVPVGVSEIKVVVLRDASSIPPLGDTPERVADFLRAIWESDPAFDNSVETLWVVFLNTRRKITGCQKVLDGTADTLLTHPREVFKPAIVMGAAAVVLAHNHPSGDPTPSKADIRTTGDVKRAGEILKIELLDHLIVIPNGTACEGRRYCSLRELGCLYS